MVFLSFFLPVGENLKQNESGPVDFDWKTFLFTFSRMYVKSILSLTSLAGLWISTRSISTRNVHTIARISRWEIKT